MKTTIHFEGYWDRVLEKAVDVGLARSKTDAVRLGVIELNNHYRLMESPETEMVARKLEDEEKHLKSSGKRYLSEKEALSKYR